MQQVVSPQDFAAYSEETGAPYPRTAEEKARAYSAVRQWKAGKEEERQQKAAEQPERNALAQVAVPLGIATLLGGAGTVGWLGWKGGRPANAKVPGPSARAPGAAAGPPRPAGPAPAASSGAPGAAVSSAAGGGVQSPPLEPQNPVTAAQVPVDREPDGTVIEPRPARQAVRGRSAAELQRLGAVHTAPGAQMPGFLPFGREGTVAASTQGLNSPGKRGNPWAHPGVSEALLANNVDQAVRIASQSGNKALLAGTRALAASWEQGPSGLGQVVRVDATARKDFTPPSPADHVPGTVIELSHGKKHAPQRYVVLGGAPENRYLQPISPKEVLQGVKAPLMAGRMATDLDETEFERIESKGGAYFTGTESFPVAGRNSLGRDLPNRKGARVRESGQRYNYMLEPIAAGKDALGMERGEVEHENFRVASLRPYTPEAMEALASHLDLETRPSVVAKSRKPGPKWEVAFKLSEAILNQEAAARAGQAKGGRLQLPEEVVANAAFSAGRAVGLDPMQVVDVVISNNRPIYLNKLQRTAPFPQGLPTDEVEIPLLRPGRLPVPGVQSEPSLSPAAAAAVHLKKLTDASPNLRNDEARFENIVDTVVRQYMPPNVAALSQQEFNVRKQEALAAYANFQKRSDPTRNPLIPAQPAGYTADRNDEWFAVWPSQVAQGMASQPMLHPLDFAQLVKSGDKEQVAAATAHFMRHNPGIAEVVSSELPNGDWLNRTNIVAEAIGAAANDFSHALEFARRSDDPVIRTAGAKMEAMGQPGAAQFEHFAKPYIRRYVAAAGLLEQGLGDSMSPPALTVSSDASKVLLLRANVMGKGENVPIRRAIQKQIGEESSLANAVWALQGLTSDLGGLLGPHEYGGFGDEPRSYGQVLANAFTSAANTAAYPVSPEDPAAPMISKLKGRLDARGAGGTERMPIRLLFATDVPEGAALSLNADMDVAKAVGSAAVAPFTRILPADIDRGPTQETATPKAASSAILANTIKELDNRQVRAAQAQKAGRLPDANEAVRQIAVRREKFKAADQLIQRHRGILNEQAVLANRNAALLEGHPESAGGLLLGIDPASGRVATFFDRQYQQPHSLDATRIDEEGQGSSRELAGTPPAPEPAAADFPAPAERGRGDETYLQARGSLQEVAGSPLPEGERQEALRRIRSVLGRRESTGGAPPPARAPFPSPVRPGAGYADPLGPIDADLPSTSAAPAAFRQAPRSLPSLEERRRDDLKDAIMRGFTGAAALQDRASYLARAREAAAAGEPLGPYRPPSAPMLGLAADRLHAQEEAALEQARRRPRILF